MKAKAWIALVLVLVCLLSACGVTQRSLVGTWKCQQTVMTLVTEVTYEFREDGTGCMNNVVDIDFTYTLQDDQLQLTTSVLGITNTESYTVSFDGGDLLLVSGSETLRLEKVK